MRRALTTVAALALSGVATLSVVCPRPAAAQAPDALPRQFLIERMGSISTESAARHGIGFRPFTPPRQIVAVVLLPPFHGPDVPVNRGIGFEYADADGKLYALAQWPANGGKIEHFAPIEADDGGCHGARSFSRGTEPSGIVWSTPHGLIMSLQPDGKNDARTLQAEWRKLIRRGICR